MHELSIVQDLLRQIDDIALAHGATTVRRVVVQVGPLAGVDLNLLASAFVAARAAGSAAGAALELEALPVRVLCRECGSESEVRPNHFLCAGCGGYRTALLSGDELVLRRVELASPSNEGVCA